MDSKLYQPIYRTSDIAKLCGITKSTVLQWIKDGKLAAFRLPGGHYRIYHDDFMAFTKAHNMPIKIVNV